MVAPAGAADFYSARVAVATADEATQRQKGLAAALHAVVAQVTGDAEVAASVVLQPEYLSAARYAKEFRFVDGSDGRRLEARFDPAAVDAMLRGYGLQPWAGRPALVIWLAGRGDGGPRLLPPESEPLVWQTLKRAAIGQGLAMVQPLFDLEDQAALPASDVSARVASPVRDASIRYDVDAVLSAFLMTAEGTWQADWMLLSGELTRRWTTRGADAAATLAAGVRDTAVMLGSLFPRPGSASLDLSLPSASAAGVVSRDADSDVGTGAATVSTVAVPAGQTVARVAGIVGPGDYNRAMSALRGNAAVERVSVIAVEPEALIVALTPAAEGAGFAEALEAGGVLQGEPSGNALATSSGISVFLRLVPAEP